MKLAVKLPSVAYREGPEAVARLARAIEHIGDDEHHVIIGFPSMPPPSFRRARGALTC